MPRMHIHSSPLQQFDRKFLVRPRSRHPQHHVPPTLNHQPRTSFLQRELAIQFRQIPRTRFSTCF